MTTQKATSDDPLLDLVMRSQDDDQRAFAELVVQTQEGVYNLAYNILGNRQEAEDMTQEIYLRVWQALPSFRGESKFTTWLYRIATNACLNRRRYLRPQLSLVDEPDTLDDLIAPQKDALVTTIEHERQAFLWEAVRALPEKYRLVITLFYRQELTYKEVAEVLSLPLGTVKAHLNRARRALAQRLRMAEEVKDVAL